MSPEIIGIIGFVVLFMLLAIGMPVAFSMAGVAIVGFITVGGLSGALVMAGTSPFSTVCSYEMSVLPLFILMGSFAFVSGLTTDAYSAANKWFGRLPGGLAIATVVGCAGFAACTGSSAASASVVTSTALPEMQRHRYHTKLSTGCIASGSTLGILIPPSLPLIVYGIIAQESIGKLFLAGIFPGLLLTILFIIVIIGTIMFKPSWGPRGPRTTLKEKLGVFITIWPLVLLVSIVVLGIWGGVFTPLEAGGVGAFTAFLIGFLRGQLNFQKMIEVFSSSIRITTMIFAIMIGAIMFNYFMALTQLPRAAAEFVASLAISPTLVVIGIMFFFLLGGCFMDVFGLIMLTLPIFIPIMISLGVNLILFGILTTITIEMALITPPIGMNVFIISGMAKDIPMYTIFRGIFPFLFAMIACLAIIIIFPEIALYLPSTIIK